MAISMPRLRPLLRSRFRRSVVAHRQSMLAATDIDLTLPEWETARDLAEDFDNKMESFMAFDDGHTGSEREWLTS